MHCYPEATSTDIAPTEIDRITLRGIQYLRGFAALAVVIFHVYAEFPFKTGHTFSIGSKGVDLFFIISGFIMYTTARNAKLILFFSRRLIRIFPLYWIATALSVLLYFFIDGRLPSGTESVLSLALIPHYSEAHPTKIWPILVPGWTLSYELWFYGLFGIGLLTRKVVSVPSFIIGLFIVLGFIIKWKFAIWVFATDPLLFEFVAGLLLGQIASRRQSLIIIALILIGFTIVASVMLGLHYLIAPLSALLIVGLTLYIELFGVMVNVPALKYLGDASYSIYLFHIPFIYTFSKLIQIIFVAPLSFSPNILALICIVLALSFGCFMHELVERPLLRTVRRLSNYQNLKASNKK